MALDHWILDTGRFGATAAARGAIVSKSAALQAGTPEPGLDNRLTRLKVKKKRPLTRPNDSHLSRSLCVPPREKLGRLKHNIALKGYSDPRGKYPIEMIGASCFFSAPLFACSLLVGVSVLLLAAAAAAEGLLALLFSLSLSSARHSRCRAFATVILKDQRQFLHFILIL